MRKDYKMKTLLTTLILIIAGITFSGCSAKNIPYDKYSIERDINKDIDKISGKSVKIIDSSEQKIIRPLYSGIGIKSPTISYELDASSINKNIAKFDDTSYSDYSFIKQVSELVPTKFVAVPVVMSIKRAHGK